MIELPANVNGISKMQKAFKVCDIFYKSAHAVHQVQSRPSCYRLLNQRQKFQLQVINFCRLWLLAIELDSGITAFKILERQNKTKTLTTSK
jgi:hypothetical protein